MWLNRLVSLALLLILTPTLTLQDQHLCDKLSAGRLQDIHLKSFTHYRPNELLLFEGNRKYSIAVNAHQLATDLQLVIPRHSTAWNLGDPPEAVGRFPELTAADQIAAVYFFLFTGQQLFWDNIAMNVVTTDQVMMEEIKHHCGIFCNPAKWSNTRANYPNYTVAATVDQASEHPRGYVLHRDMFDHPTDYVMYDLKMDPSDMALHVHTKTWTVQERKQARFYYLHKAERPEYMYLVPRPNHLPRPNPDDEQPSPHRLNLLVGDATGFRANKHLYLFDSGMACVYVLALNHDLHNYMGTDPPSDITVQRVKNIPYERFFKCDGGDDPQSNRTKRSAWNQEKMNRCDTTTRQPPAVPEWSAHYNPSVNPNQLYTTAGVVVEYNQTSVVAAVVGDWFANPLMYGALATGLMAVLFVLSCVLCFVSIHQGKGRKKRGPHSNGANLMDDVGGGSMLSGVYSAQSSGRYSAKKPPPSRPRMSKKPTKPNKSPYRPAGTTTTTTPITSLFTESSAILSSTPRIFPKQDKKGVLLEKKVKTVARIPAAKPAYPVSPHRVLPPRRNTVFQVPSATTATALFLDTPTSTQQDYSGVFGGVTPVKLPKQQQSTPGKPKTTTTTNGGKANQGTMSQMLG